MSLSSIICLYVFFVDYLCLCQGVALSQQAVIFTAVNFRKKQSGTALCELVRCRIWLSVKCLLSLQGGTAVVLVVKWLTQP